VPGFVWLSLLLFAVAIATGIALAAVRGLEAWRAFSRLQRRADELLLELDERVAGIDQRAATFETASRRLEEATARLRRSLATAGVLWAALDEARALLTGVRGAMPQK
jgi:hypothetical protein